MRRRTSKRDQKRARFSRRKKIELTSKERPDAKMGDLHLREAGLVGRPSRKLRQKLKRSTSRARRRHGRELSRRYLSQ